MKIISARERSVNIASDASNAAISFDTMTASAVVVEVETQRGRFKGLGFSSIGRYGHSGLLRERFIPRLLHAKPADLVDPESGTFSMSRAWSILMANEKEGGHGERSGAVGVLESALWDAWAKSEDLPLWALLQRECAHIGDDGPPAGQTIIYASGGHYHSGADGLTQLADEVQRGLDNGYAWFKMKIGGASESIDRARLRTAINTAGDPARIAVDANCSCNRDEARATLSALDQLSLRWIEEPVAPLNYAALARTTAALQTPIATGENIFSVADTQNLLRYGGLRPGKDLLQIDLVLSYGITEFMRIIEIAESCGWSRRDFVPHAGHQFALHACAGLGLGAHETAGQPGPFGDVCDNTKIENGIATLGGAPGAGIEHKPALYQFFAGLMD